MHPRELMCPGNLCVSVDVCQGSFPWTRWERRLGPRQTWRRPDRRAETRCWVCFPPGPPSTISGPLRGSCFQVCLENCPLAV